MGRPPCCDKVGIKKGPWTPEEDIILVSYIQEHGPGNWRSVPTNTGLLRCSKSCRLRWTNYLRPGIKRGNFTPHEEGMIIHLQALLGNKWAAIASYLPQRTDNDIKNYWNTHLKKKLKKFQSALDPHMALDPASTTQFVSKGFNSERRSSLDMSSPPPSLRVNQSSSTYASSTENISRLLEGWMRSSPKNNNDTTHINEPHEDNTVNDKSSNFGNSASVTTSTTLQCYQPKAEQEGGGGGGAGGGGGGGDIVSHEDFDSILSFENMNNAASAWDKSTCDSMPAEANKTSQTDANDDKVIHVMTERNRQRSENSPPLSILEKWLFDETAAGQVEEMMELSPMF